MATENPGMFPEMEAALMGSMFNNLAAAPSGKDDPAGGEGTTMFSSLAGHYDNDPRPHEMAKAKMEAVRYERKVKFLGIHVHTLDLSKAADVKEYKKLRSVMYSKVRTQEYVVQHFERTYTEAGGNPRWLIHLEIHEYEFISKDILEQSPIGGK